MVVKTLLPFTPERGNRLSQLTFEDDSIQVCVDGKPFNYRDVCEIINKIPLAPSEGRVLSNRFLLTSLRKLPSKSSKMDFGYYNSSPGRIEDIKCSAVGLSFKITGDYKPGQIYYENTGLLIKHPNSIVVMIGSEDETVECLSYIRDADDRSPMTLCFSVTEAKTTIEFVLHSFLTGDFTTSFTFKNKDSKSSRKVYNLKDNIKYNSMRVDGMKLYFKVGDDTEKYIKLKKNNILIMANRRRSANYKSPAWHVVGEPSNETFSEITSQKDHCMCVLKQVIDDADWKEDETLIKKPITLNGFYSWLSTYKGLQGKLQKASVAYYALLMAKKNDKELLAADYSSPKLMQEEELYLNNKSKPPHSAWLVWAFEAMIKLTPTSTEESKSTSTEEGKRKAEEEIGNEAKHVKV